jgi:hypothetical protein
MAHGLRGRGSRAGSSALSEWRARRRKALRRDWLYLLGIIGTAAASVAGIAEGGSDEPRGSEGQQPTAD